MKKFVFFSVVATVLLLCSCGSDQTKTFKTDYFAIDIDSRGYIVGMHDLTRQNRNFSPADQPSPLLSLYDSKQKRTLYPQKARYSNNEYKLEYENGSVATVGLDQKDKYFKLTLKSVEPRHDIQGVQWGNYYTNINNLFGEVIGVARDTSAAVNFAIGALALDDNTIGGESRYTSEAGGGFGYVAHSADPVNNPLPVTLHEGMQFTIGGDGHSDVAFYNRREPYYRIIYGSTAGVDNNGRVNIRYHSRDRRKGGMIYSPEGAPVMVNNEPNHLMRQAVPGLDFVGSSIALWGSPDSLALMDVIQDVVLKEGLPYPTFQGKWVKDPTSFMPDVTTYGGLYDSIASYTKQMGLSVILAYDQGFLRPNRANGGYLDGKDYANKPFRLTSGNLSHREYADLLAKDGLILGRTNITTSLAPGTQDANPPSDSICIQHRRFLTQDLSATDTLIYIDDATHMEEIACWEGHNPELNMVRIGKELIHYLGVSTTKPYRLLNVTRGYWNTTPASYTAGAAVDKLQVTVIWGYEGLVPNLELQDEIARYYGDVAAYNGLGLYDFDGQEFLFHSGFGTYSVKRFFRNMFDQAKKHNLADIRFTGATLSEGSWHYQSIWNVGGGKNIYDVEKRVWGSTTSQGKDLRDVNFANFFPSSFGVNFPITEKSTVEQYEHIQATAVGYQTTYMLSIGQKDVESCPQKYAIFNVIRTWEEARRADAFPTHIRKMLQDPALSWRLETMPDAKGWILYQMVDGQKGQSYNLYAKN